MSRQETFEKTKTFEVDSGATLKFQGLELAGEAVSGQDVDVKLSTVPTEGGNSYYVTLEMNGSQILDKEFTVEDGWGGASRSNRVSVTVPDSGSFDVTARGGVIK